MPNFYIHVGMPKTGTSSIQHALYTHRDILCTQYNLYYPTAGLTYETDSEVRMHRNLFPIHNFKENWRTLQEEVQQIPDADIIISEEMNSIAFPTCDASGKTGILDGYIGLSTLPYIQSLFQGYTIKIVLCIRRNDDYIKSFAAEHARRGNTLAYREFVESLYDTGDWNIFTSNLIDYYRQCVGVENLITFFYPTETNSEILQHFFQATGRQFPTGLYEATRSKRKNLSLPKKCLPFLLGKYSAAGMLSPERIERIRELISYAYSYPTACNIDEKICENLQKEIDIIEEKIPGYVDLFNDRPLSYDWPDVDPDPEMLCIITLLYELLETIDKSQRDNRELLKTQETILGEIRKSQNEIKKPCEKKARVKFSHGVRAFIQSVIVSLYGIWLHISGQRKNRKKLYQDPQAFFSNSKFLPRRLLGKLYMKCNTKSKSRNHP